MNRLNSYLNSHLIDPDLVRRDLFEEFMRDRQKKLLGLIEKAIGKPAYLGENQDEGLDLEYGDEEIQVILD